MAKTRLSAPKRELLNLLVHKLVVNKETEKHIQEEHDKLQKLLKEEIRKQFPPKDIKVLRKYGLTKHKDNVSILRSYSNEQKDPLYDHYDIYLDISIELPGTNTWATTSQQKLRLTADSDIHLQYLLLDKLKEKYKECIDAKRKPYFELITAARYFEDVLEVWSEVEEIRSKVCGKTSVMALSPKDVITIRKDVNERKKTSKEN